MRILVIASETPPTVSGVAASVDRLVTGFRKRGHDVEMLSAADARYLVRGEFRISGLGLEWRRVRRRIDAFDAIHIHGPAPSISDVFLGLVGMRRRFSSGPPLLYTHHFTVELEARWSKVPSAAYDHGTRYLARLADQVVVTSSAYAALFQHALRRPAVVIPWGVDADRFVARCREPDDTGPLRVLYVGQLREYKGARVAIDAVAGLPGVELTVVGGGPLADELADRVGAETDNVFLAGRLDDESLVAAYRDHDVIVLPSVNRLEAFGITLLEGMASGCVPVATTLPGVDQVASPTGLLARTGSSDDLRWAFRFLADHPAVVRDLQRRSIEQVRELTWERAIDQYQALLERLVAAGNELG